MGVGILQNRKNAETVRVVSIVGLAEYQQDSIVSRTLIDTKAGTVTFFAFDEGQCLSEHVTPFDALVNILDGEAEVQVSEKLYHIKQGEMVILPANKPHALKATKKFKMMLTMIRG